MNFIEKHAFPPSPDDMAEVMYIEEKMQKMVEELKEEGISYTRIMCTLAICATVRILENHPEHIRSAIAAYLGNVALCHFD